MRRSRAPPPPVGGSAPSRVAVASAGCSLRMTSAASLSRARRPRRRRGAAFARPLSLLRHALLAPGAAAPTAADRGRRGTAGVRRRCGRRHAGQYLEMYILYILHIFCVFGEWRWWKHVLSVFFCVSNIFCCVCITYVCTIVSRIFCLCLYVQSFAMNLYVQVLVGT